MKDLWIGLDKAWKYVLGGDPTFEGLSIAATLKFPVPTGAILLLEPQMNQKDVSKIVKESIMWIEDQEKCIVGENNRKGMPLFLSIRFGNKHIDERKPKSISYLGATSGRYGEEFRKCIQIFKSYCEIDEQNDYLSYAQEIVYKAFLYLKELNIEKPYILIQRTALSLFDQQSGHGTAYSRHPQTGEVMDYGRYLLNYSGREYDYDMQGSKQKKDLLELKNEFPEAYNTLKTLFSLTELYFDEIRFFEFVIESGKIQIVQIAPRKRKKVVLKERIQVFDCVWKYDINHLCLDKFDYSHSVNLDGIQFDFASNCKQDLDNVCAMFSFYNTSGKMQRKWKVNLVNHSLPDFEISGGEPVKILHSKNGIHLMALRYYNNREVYFWIPRESVLVKIDYKKKTVYVIGENKSNHGINDIANKIVLNIWRNFLEYQGWYMMHGATIISKNKAVLLVGNKTSGKTTVQMKFLSENYNIGSFDRTLIKIENGNVYTHPWPSNLRVASKTLEFFPMLKQWFLDNNQKNSSKVQVDFYSFAKRFGVDFRILKLEGIVILNRNYLLKNDENLSEKTKSISSFILKDENDNWKDWLKTDVQLKEKDFCLPENIKILELHDFYQLDYECDLIKKEVVDNYE